jgi:hypothetical protein
MARPGLMSDPVVGIVIVAVVAILAIRFLLTVAF